MEVIRFLSEKHGDRLMPVVNTEFGKTPPDRYLLQWNGRGLGMDVLNTFIRFLLHGLVLRALDRSIIQLSSHLLRHAFATEVPIEVVEHGILLGCSRKYMTLLTTSTSGLILSLSYFQNASEETAPSKVTGDDWRYLHHRVDGLEKGWLREAGLSR